MCDTFASIGPWGARFAKTSDRPPTEAQVLEWHPPRPPGGILRTQYLEVPDPGAYGTVLSRPTWLWGAEHGVNEYGLAVGNERVWSRRDLTGPPALIGMDLVRLTLERARTADEGLDVLTRLLAEHGQGGSCDATHDDPYDSSFLCCDAHGGWILETSGRDWIAAPLTGHGAISNRYTLGDHWTRSSAGVAPGFRADDWHDPSVDTRLADHRLGATTACAAQQPDERDMVATQRHHGSGPWGAPGRGDEPRPLPVALGDDLSGVTVCMHIPGLQATTAALVCALPAADGPVRAWACLGSPCVGLYLPFALRAVPRFLSDPAQWQRTAALRARVESEPETLRSIRAALDPVEAELWARADALDDESPDAWERLARDASRLADEALTAAGV
ncbi:MAG: hypothetical protein AMXMBFR46_10790 [Acidimicrobiia bacterium]